MNMASPASKRNLAAGHPPAFPPSIVVAVKALACELPHRCGLPLSRWSLADIQREVVAEGIVAQVSGSTLWRWFSREALCPWRYRSWIFPRDPNFAAKAGRVLDLYQGCWRGAPLGRRDFVLSADEKTSIQARIRIYPSLPPAPGRCTRIEHEYQRAGACAYIAAWDVHRARLFGRCENTTGIQPFDRLVEQVMAVEPYRSARRVFWITDNGSSHRGEKAAHRLRAAWPSIVLVHTPVHASWLNQIEIYFSIVQRKVLTPNDFSSLAELQQHLLAFQDHYQQAARPFQWNFTRTDLHKLLARLSYYPLRPAA
jgi:transposase